MLNQPTLDAQFLFCYSNDGNLGELLIKDDTISDADFFYSNLLDCDNIDFQHVYKLEKGEDVPAIQIGQREGWYEEDTMYIVLSAADVALLQTTLSQAKPAY